MKYSSNGASSHDAESECGGLQGDPSYPRNTAWEDNLVTLRSHSCGQCSLTVLPFCFWAHEAKLTENHTGSNRFKFKGLVI